MNWQGNSITGAMQWVLYTSLFVRGKSYSYLESTGADAPKRDLIISLKVGLHAAHKNTLYRSAIVSSAFNL